MAKKVVAVVGSYRREGTIDQAVQAILAAARSRGAATHIIYLTEKHIDFCCNCLECTQAPGEERGKCSKHDDLEEILKEIEDADAVILGSPVNCGDTTAIFRQFMERLLGCTDWPWGQAAPRARRKTRPRKAVLVASAAMPGFMIPMFTGTMKALKTTAGMLEARPVGRMYIGLASYEPHQKLTTRKRARARRLGVRLAA